MRRHQVSLQKLNLCSNPSKRIGRNLFEPISHHQINVRWFSSLGSGVLLGSKRFLRHNPSQMGRHRVSFQKLNLCSNPSKRIGRNLVEPSSHHQFNVKWFSALGSCVLLGSKQFLWHNPSQMGRHQESLQKLNLCSNPSKRIGRNLFEPSFYD